MRAICCIPVKRNNKFYGIIKIDYADRDMFKEFKWHISAAGYVIRAQLSKINKLRPPLFLHREILKAPKGKVVDHINHNKLDNRRSNLRICSQAENTQNTKVYKNNKSGYTGVFYNKHIRGKKWQAMITLNNKQYIKYCATREEAIKERKKLAKKYFKEFAPKVGS